MPRPPADSRLDLMYARSSKAPRSTLMIRSIAGLMVSETIKTHSTVAWVILPNGTVSEERDGKERKIMRADSAKVEWDPVKKHWHVQIHVGAEVIKRSCPKLSESAGDEDLRAEAVQ